MKCSVSRQVAMQAQFAIVPMLNVQIMGNIFVQISKDRMLASICYVYSDLYG